MIFPNVIIPGAQKSGTTALCSFLDQHPECLVSAPKEPNFFSRDANLKDMTALSRCFVPQRGTSPRVFIDGTTTYMADPRIASRIKAALGPDLKFIFTLRDPVKRSYSGYLHMLKRGHDRRNVLEVFLALPDGPDEAAAAERAAIAKATARKRLVVWPYVPQYDDVLWNFRYVGNSQFSEQVEVYEREFGADRILVLLFEDMIRDIAPVRSRLSDFLGIPVTGFPAALPHENVTAIPATDRLLGRLIEQARRIKRGNFVLVRSDEGRAPLKPAPEVDAKLRRIHARETDYWSTRLDRDLRDLGW